MPPAEALATCHRLLAATDEVLERPLAGLYLTGSSVLHDYVPGISDVDFVAVLATRHSDLPVDDLAAVHAELPNTDGLYVTAAQLQAAPAEVGEVLHAREGQVWWTDDHVTPVTWHTLADHGATVRGAPASSLGIALDRDALAQWCRGNLRSYWAMWAREGADPASERARAIETDRGVAWCVLGVLRLAYTIATGEIASKRGAGRYGLATMPERRHPLIAEAITLRTSPPSLHPPEHLEAAVARARRKQVLELMDEVIAAA